MLETQMPFRTHLTLRKGILVAAAIFQHSSLLSIPMFRNIALYFLLSSDVA